MTPPVHDPDRYRLEELEPRILLSADAAGVFADDDSGIGPDGYESRVWTPTEDLGNAIVAPVSVSDTRREIAFIDASVDDYERLVADLRAGPGDARRIDVILLDAKRDGIDQVSEVLAGYRDLDAIHIVSHGTGGSVQLGVGTFSGASVASYRDQLIGWGDALGIDADLLFYGCELAANDAGRSLVETLSALTGADVAASTDDTGHVGRGADWDLEFTTGAIETDTAFSPVLENTWDHRLAVVEDSTSTGTSTGGNFSVSHTTAGADRLMLVGVSMNLAVGSEVVDSVTYNGDSLTLVGIEASNDARIEVWSLVAPDVGTFNVDVVFNSPSDGNTAAVMTFTGVDQSTPLGTFASDSGNGTSGSATVTSAVGELVYAVISVDENTDYDLIPDGSQDEEWDLFAPEVNGGGSTLAGAASVNMGWSWPATPDRYAIGAVAIKPIASALPVVSLPGGALSVTEGDGATIIDGAATVTDADSADFDTGTLTVDFTANSTANDRLSIEDQGAGVGNISRSGSNVTYDFGAGAVVIGTFAGGTDGSTPLVITFNASATPAAAQALARAITYDNVGTDPDTTSRTVRFVVTDGDGGTSTAVTETINVSGDNILVVTTTSDDSDGTTTSIDALLADRGVDGEISLREAIEATNATANGGSPDEIHFDLSLTDIGHVYYQDNGGAGFGVPVVTTLADGAIADFDDDYIGGAGAGYSWWQISPGSALPTISQAVIIDGTTQSGYGTVPLIEIEGSGAGATPGLTITGGGSTVEAVAINSFTGIGISIASNGSNTIASSYIGTDITGTEDLGNTSYGILVNGTASNVIGGNGGSDGNVISGNGNHGVYVLGAGATGNRIEGNLIGLSATGLTTLTNDEDAINISNAPSNSVGGTTVNHRNVIAAASGTTAIDISGTTTTGTVVEGNYIGTASDGTTKLTAGSFGIGIFEAGNTRIGGTTTTAANVIAGYTVTGISIAQATAAGTVVQGNSIGTDAGGTLDLTNGFYGVTLQNSATDVEIGGAAAGAGNLIANHSSDGVRLFATNGDDNPILRNQIYSNGGLAINNVGGTEFSSVTTNDPDDADSGPNELLNFPVLTNVVQSGADLDLDFDVDLVAGSYRIEFFDNANGLDSSGFGEGETFIGSANIVVTGAAGYESFSTTLSGVTASDILNITTTATEADGTFTTFGSTSEFGPHFLGAGVIEVTTTDDTDDGDTSSIAALLGDRGADGEISLEEAIVATNNTANLGGNPDAIRFEIAAALGGDGAHTIVLGASGLTTISDSVVIDGTTDSDFGTTPMIVLDGSAATGSPGLRITGGGSTVRGLVIHSFGQSGIDLSTAGTNTIEGNYIGTDVAGNAFLGNGSHGIYIDNVGGNTIGGIDGVATRNVISGNDLNGIEMTGASATGNAIQGNYIGVDAAGTGNLANTQDGVYLNTNSNSNTVGGSLATQRNIISANGDDGIEVVSGANNNTIAGNYIGTDFTGLVGLGNTEHGVVLYDGVHDNTIGGNGAGNVISDHGGSGIVIDGNGDITTADNIVRGNFIGTDKDGSGDLGNGARGIYLFNSTSDTIIGGIASGDGNTVANSTGDGIALAGSASDGNSVLRNTIFDNGGLGIDLVGGTEDGFGVTDNDGDDADSGPNELQNYPVLVSVVTNGVDTITIDGTLDTDLLTQDYRIEFFASVTEDGSSHGEAERYLGFTTVTTDGSGDATFSTALTPIVVAAGEFVTATATVDLGGGSFGDTSEFGLNQAATINPVVTLPGAAVNFTEGDGATIIDSGATVTDADSADFNTGTLTIDFTANSTANDRLAVNDQGAGVGNIALSGSDVTYDFGAGAVVIGTFAGGTDGSTPLVITFNASATPAAAQALARNITFDNVSEDPDETARTVRFVVTDGDTGTSTAVTETINVTGDNDDPVVALPSGAVSFTEGDGATIIDGAATVSDVDSADFNTGTLAIDFTAGSTANDRLAINDQGPGVGNIALSGSDVTYDFGAGAVVIGTFAGGTDGSTPLVITFNASANPTAAQALARNITFDNVSEDPDETARTVRFVVTDGDTGTSTAVTETINVAGDNDDPVVALPGGAVSFTEGDGATIIDGAATVSDVDSADFNTGTLTVDFTANSTANDRLAINDQGAGVGNISLSGTDVTYDFGAGAVVIGTFAGGTDGSTPLVVTFNASATPAAAQALTRQHHVRQRFGRSGRDRAHRAFRRHRWRYRHEQCRDRDDQRRQGQRRTGRRAAGRCLELHRG